MIVAVELIDPGVNGLLLEDDFGAAFELLEQPDRLEHMRRAARTTAEAYTWSHHADQVEALYAQVASH